MFWVYLGWKKSLFHVLQRIRIESYNKQFCKERYPSGGRWENHRIEHGKKKDFHIGCNKERTISFWFSLQIRVFLKAQKKKRIYGTLINVGKWKKKKKIYIYI